MQVNIYRNVVHWCTFVENVKITQERKQLPASPGLRVGVIKLLGGGNICSRVLQIGRSLPDKKGVGESCRPREQQEWGIRFPKQGSQGSNHSPEGCRPGIDKLGSRPPKELGPKPLNNGEPGDTTATPFVLMMKITFFLKNSRVESCA